MTRILFVKTTSLGDVVHHMPALADARRFLPDARFSWAVEESFAPLVKLHPLVDEVIPVATRRWRSQLLKAATWGEIATLRRRLRAHFDIVVDTQGLIRSALLARMAGGVRHGYDTDSIREPLASRLYDVTHTVSRAQHAVARNRKLTALALGYTFDEAIDYGFPRGGAGAGTPYAVLLHATSRVEKEWPEEKWIAIGRGLRARGFGVVLPWGNAAEEERSNRLTAAIEKSVVLPRQSLDATAKVIAEAALVIGVDTGLLHLAAAYAVPLVGIYVATAPGRTGPVGPGRIEVTGGKGTPPSFDEVIAAAEKVLRG